MGEGAQREIYISWESAVKNAYERYGVVIENYRMGRYPKHDSQTDEFFHGMAGWMDALNRSREVQQQIRSAMQLQTLLERRRELQRQFRDSIESNVEELRNELTEERRRINEQLSEFYRQLDRFH